MQLHHFSAWTADCFSYAELSDAVCMQGNKLKGNRNMNDKNQEVIDFLKTLKSHYSANFKKFRPELYEFILEYTKFLDC